MKQSTTIFNPAEILLPAFAADPRAMQRWAVIACDQFTSEPGYWNACRAFIGEHPSTLGYFMPEAYIGGAEEEGQGKVIRENMTAFDERSMRPVYGFIRVERTLPGGGVRRGLLGAIDLEAYDYGKDSSSPVRATEGTVVERIPPRCKIRAEAVAELPHILVLTRDDSLFRAAEKLSGDLIYDFELMQGGGHIRGFALTDTDVMTREIAAYEASSSGIAYAMGDGNHSLAAAKAHWNNIKEKTGDLRHPARYALCELTPLTDDSLEFEPIYRLVKHVDPEEVLRALEEVTVPADDGAGDVVTAVTAKGERKLRFKKPSHVLTVGTVQNFIDGFLSSHPAASCDYIHGEESLKRLASEPDAAGFLFRGMRKDELFPYVENNGPLPKKTFSMGEAESKRYYLEMRKIVK